MRRDNRRHPHSKSRARRTPHPARCTDVHPTRTQAKTGGCHWFRRSPWLASRALSFGFDVTRAEVVLENRHERSARAMLLDVRDGLIERHLAVGAQISDSQRGRAIEPRVAMKIYALAARDQRMKILDGGAQ